MSRQPRAGRAAHPVTFRATTTERAHWERASKAEGCSTLSAWIVKTLKERATRVAPGKSAEGQRCGRCPQ